MSPTTTFPVRYFSIVTVPKEFTHQMGQIENTALSGGFDSLCHIGTKINRPLWQR